VVRGREEVVVVRGREEVVVGRGRGGCCERRLL
jgi:hypothetical protein